MVTLSLCSTFALALVLLLSLFGPQPTSAARGGGGGGRGGGRGGGGGRGRSGSGGSRSDSKGGGGGGVFLKGGGVNKQSASGFGGQVSSSSVPKGRGGGGGGLSGSSSSSLFGSSSSRGRVVGVGSSLSWASSRAKRPRTNYRNGVRSFNRALGPGLGLNLASLQRGVNGLALGAIGGYIGSFAESAAPLTLNETLLTWAFDTRSKCGAKGVEVDYDILARETMECQRASRVRLLEMESRFATTSFLNQPDLDAIQQKMVDGLALTPLDQGTLRVGILEPICSVLSHLNDCRPAHNSMSDDSDEGHATNLPRFPTLAKAYECGVEQSQKDVDQMIWILSEDFCSQDLRWLFAFLDAAIGCGCGAEVVHVLTSPAFQYRATRARQHRNHFLSLTSTQKAEKESQPEPKLETELCTLSAATARLLWDIVTSCRVPHTTAQVQVGQVRQQGQLARPAQIILDAFRKSRAHFSVKCDKYLPQNYWADMNPPMALARATTTKQQLTASILALVPIYLVSTLLFIFTG